MTYKFQIGQVVGIRGGSCEGRIVSRRFSLFSFRHKTPFPARYYTIVDQKINGLKFEEREDDFESLADREKRGTWKDEEYMRKRYGGLFVR